MPRTSSDTRLIVFTKAPNPGAVKTRLIPLLGEAGAAALHRRLIERTLAMARAAAVGPVELHGAPDASDPFLGECAQRYGALLTSQVPGNLGARMAAAMEQTLSSARYAILIGTDCPVLNAGHIREARDALAAGAHAVFAPAEDGGYALIALARCDRRLFRRVAWGEASVMNQTRNRLSQLGWRWRELETVWDVDRPEDYQRLAALHLLRKDNALIPG